MIWFLLAIWILGLVLMGLFMSHQYKSKQAKPELPYRRLFIPGFVLLLFAANLTAFYSGKQAVMFLIAFASGYLARGLVYLNRTKF